MVRLEGFEPPTDGLEIRCSIHLSYRRADHMEIGRGERIRTSGPLLPKQVRYQTAPRPDRDWLREKQGNEDKRRP